MQSIYEIRDYKSGQGPAFTGTLYKEGLIFGTIERYRNGGVDIVPYPPNELDEVLDYSNEMFPTYNIPLYEHVNRLLYVVVMNRTRGVCYVEDEAGEAKFWEQGGAHIACKSRISLGDALYLLKENDLHDARIWVKERSEFVHISEF